MSDQRIQDIHNAVGQTIGGSAPPDIALHAADTVYNNIVALGTWSPADLATLRAQLSATAVSPGLTAPNNVANGNKNAWNLALDNALAQAYLQAWAPASAPAQPAGVNQNSGTIAATNSATFNVGGQLTNQNNGWLFSVGDMNITASSVLNSSSTIQTQSNLAVTAGALTNRITSYTLGSGLATASAAEGANYSVSTDIVQNQYVSASTGQSRILADGGMNFNVGTLTNNSSIIAAGTTITGAFSYTPVNPTSAQETTWDSSNPSNTTLHFTPLASPYSPVMSAHSIVATIPNLNSANVNTPTTGVGGNVATVTSGGDPGTANGGSGSGATGVSGSVNTTGSQYGPTTNSGSIGGPTPGTTPGNVNGTNTAAVLHDVALGATTGPRYTPGAESGTGLHGPQGLANGPPVATTSGSIEVSSATRSAGVVGRAAGDGAGTTVTATSGSAAGTVQTAIPAGGSIVEIGTPNLNIPTSGLYTTNHSAHFLITTNAAFANNSVSSALLISATDPRYAGPILGDGFYEQQLVQQQITQLTGHQFLDGYTSATSQYAALLTSGTQYAQQFNLQLGVALTPAQMAQLTSDMVWMVSEVVGGESVLVPVVYLANVSGNDVKPNGTLIAANDINIQTNDLNNFGTIVGTHSTQIVAANSINNTGTITSGGNTTLVAGGDILNHGGTISAGGNLGLQAGGNIVVDPTIKIGSRTAIGFANETPQTITSVGTLSAGGNMTVLSTGNINLVAANVQAGGDIVVSGSSVTATSAKNVAYSVFNAPTANGFNYDEQVVGTNISAGGALSIGAKNDVTIKASTATAGGALTIAAGGKVSITNDIENHAAARTSTTTTTGFLSSTKTTTSDSSAAANVVGSTLSGDTVTVSAGKSLAVTGSNIVGTNDVSLYAGKDLTIASAQSTSSSSHSSSSTTTGFMAATSGIAFSFGTLKNSSNITDDEMQQIASNIGSLNGSLTVAANGDAKIVGSSLSASQNLAIVGSSVDILAAYDTSHIEQKSSSSFSGFTASLGSPALSAAQGAIGYLQQANSVKDPRLAALLGVEASQDISKLSGSLKKGGGGVLGGASVSPSFGTSSSTSASITDTSTAVGSMLSGGNVAILASKGDINVVGSTISGGDVSLQAAQNIALSAAQNTSTTQSSSTATSSSIGVSMAIGPNASKPGADGKVPKAGPTFDIATASSQSNSTSTSTQYVNSVIAGTGTVSITSGKDLTLAGAQISGSGIVADITRNLTLRSLQDTNGYNATSSSSSASVSFSGNVGSGSFNSSNGHTDSTYASVTNQTGFFAGTDGFQINVGGKTSLTGAVIASLADPSKNGLTTTTFEYKNIVNSASYDASSNSFGFSAGVAAGAKTPDQVIGFGTTAVQGSGSSSSLSAIADGHIVVRDDTATGQNSLAGRSRDTANSANSLAQIFNQQTVSETLELSQLFSKLGMEAAGAIADSEFKKTRTTKDRDPDNVWSENGIARDALHGMVAAVTAAISGGNVGGAIAGTMTAGAAEKIIKTAVDKAVTNLPKELQLSVADLGINVLTGVVGKLVGGAVGGSSGAAGGLQSSLSADEFNRQLNQNQNHQLEIIIAGLKGTPEEIARETHVYEALGCYLNRCAAQIPSNDPKYNEKNQLQNDGANYSASGLFDIEKNKLVATNAFSTNPFDANGYNWVDAFKDNVQKNIAEAYNAGKVYDKFPILSNAADPYNPGGTGLCNLPYQPQCAKVTPPPSAAIYPVSQGALLAAEYGGPSMKVVGNVAGSKPPTPAIDVQNPSLIDSAAAPAQVSSGTGQHDFKVIGTVNSSVHPPTVTGVVAPSYVVGVKPAPKFGSNAPVGAPYAPRAPPSPNAYAAPPIYTIAAAKKLPKPNKGLIYVLESPTGKANSVEFQDGTTGAHSSIFFRKPVVPALRYTNDNPRGYDFVKFDGEEIASDGTKLLIDSKTRFPLESQTKMNGVASTLKRVESALSQNSGFAVVYEFQTVKAAADATKWLKDNHLDNIVSVRVRK